MRLRQAPSRIKGQLQIALAADAARAVPLCDHLSNPTPNAKRAPDLSEAPFLQN